MSDIIVQEAALEEVDDFLAGIVEGQIITSPEEYRPWSRSIADGQHRYFVALKFGRRVGVSAMTKECERDAVYHRAGYTLPDHRRLGVWRALWRHKIEYVERNRWNTPDTMHWVIVSGSDDRYRRMRWLLGDEIEHDRFGTVTRKQIWFQFWSVISSHGTQLVSSG